MTPRRADRPGGGHGIALALAFSGCGPRYVPPALPPEQLAVVTLDKRAEIMEVDGLPLQRSPSHDGPIEFYVGPGCRVLTVKYEASYFIWGEKKAAKSGVGSGLWASLANTEVHDYETAKPIRFFVPAKPRHKYWVTASFTGDQFLPRAVEINPDGESGARFLPDEPCSASGPK